MNPVASIDVRHNVGTCPACREYLWATVTVNTEVSDATIAADGKCYVYANAAPVAMTVSHECAKATEEPA